MASQLPTYPRVLFTIIEPISFLAGFAGATIDPVSFVTEQVPQVPPALVNDNSLVLAWQLGNAYLLLFFIAISLFTSTSEVKVIRHYLYALALGDIGHVGWTCYGIGLERVKDPGSWSVAIWGNIAFTVFLFFSRAAYLLGLFGPDRPAVAKQKRP